MCLTEKLRILACIQKIHGRKAVRIMGHRKRPEWELNAEIKLVEAFISLFSSMPHKTSQVVGGIFGVLFHDLVGIRKQHTREMLRMAFPQRGERWARETTREVYRHLGMVAAEMARIPLLAQFKFDYWVQTRGSKAIREALDNGKGALVVSAHMGNWEYGGAWGAANGYPVSYVVASQANPGIEEIIDDIRRSSGIEIIKKANAARGILDGLKRNRLIAIMMDQDAHDAGVFVPFFDRPASTPRGAATFALKTGAPIFIMLTHRAGNGKTRVEFVPVPVEKTKDKQEDIRRITAWITARLEQGIRENPEQWLWLHRRWKTQPKNEDK